MNKKECIVSAVASIALGVLFIVLKNDVISVALTVFGVLLLCAAVFDFVHRFVSMGIVKAVLGVCVLVFGWVFVNLALYILAAAIIIMGLLQIVNTYRAMLVGFTFGEKCLLYLKPVGTVIAGACLLFNQGGTVAWVFIATGVLLVAVGILEIVDAVRQKA
ncbi:MAG: DUF308 domain-containing protein [Candidatus Fimenecus sp.]